MSADALPAADPLSSPIKGLFSGQIVESALFPYPEPSADERETVSAFLDSLRSFAKDRVDPAVFDREKRIPPDVVKRARGPGNLRAHDSRGVRRLRLLVFRVLPRDGGDRLDRRVARHPDRGTPVHRNESAPPLRVGGAEETLASIARRRREDRGLRSHRARGGVRRRLDPYDRAIRRREGRVRPGRHQALDLERRNRGVLHRLREGRRARREGRAPADHRVRGDAGPARTRDRPGGEEARPEGLFHSAARVQGASRPRSERHRGARRRVQGRRRGPEHRPDVARSRLRRRIEDDDPSGRPSRAASGGSSGRGSRTSR